VNIPGIHHITAIASDPDRNLDFYTRVLGLRLVKLTVNFDDPGTYHFYFGDEAGRPGSILTFFPWPGTPRGRHGTGQASVVSFSVPSLDGWEERLTNYTVTRRFGADVLSFTDPDGMAIDLVAVGGNGGAITGFHGVTLSASGYESTARLLTDTFGYELTASEGNRFRYTGSAGNHVDVLCQPDARRGGMGAGTIHHVAFRAETDEIQKRWQTELAHQGFDVTPVLDRRYFHSIYFREPGGVLFEIATDPPGFAIDETLENLGAALQLPPALEPMRTEIEEMLPKLKNHVSRL
jgi:glyoxalase family protein